MQARIQGCEGALVGWVHHLDGHVLGVAAGNDQAVSPLQTAAHFRLQVQLHTRASLAQQTVQPILPACTLKSCTIPQMYITDELPLDFDQISAS